MAPPGPAGERRVRGGGVYPRCSLINHECAPNAARFDAFDAAGPAGGASSSSSGGGGGGDGGGVLSSGGGYPLSTAVSIRAMHDLPEGTEIVQSYFPLNWDLRERRRQAREVYGFECCCPRCLAEAAPGWGGASGESGSGSGSGSEWETEDGEEDGADEMEHERQAAASGGDQQQQQQQQQHYHHQQQQHEVAAGTGPGSSGGTGDDRGPLDPTYLQLFLLKYMCPRKACFGTMAAVLGSDLCECNVCGGRRSEAEFLAELEG
jgi:SET and MYND domain-containing protein